MEFTINNVFKSAVQRGIKYAIPVFLNAVFWLLTIWIPYLNVGTTIGLFIGVVAKVSRDEEVEITEIFKPEYRKNMGEFFLVTGFISAGMFMGFLFFIIPGYVIGIAWMFAPFFVVDKNINPSEAISKSNSITYGKKWTIFFTYLVVSIILFIVFTLVGIIGTQLVKIPAIGDFLSVVLIIATVGFSICVQMATTATIYGELAK